MIRLPRYGSSEPDGPKSETFEFLYHHDMNMMRDDQLPAYHESHDRSPVITTYHD